MSRPAVSVVMPFAGDAAAARAAVATLRSLETEPGDEVILADNVGVAPPADAVRIVAARSERSAAHARNVGAEHASAEWILFIDADCTAPADLLRRYFVQPVAAEVGALAGEVMSSAEAGTAIGRYGAARGFLSQRAHLAHPFRPRAVAANLLVRRSAFEQLGGFYEGLWAAEDTDFCWRLQDAGWRLELRAEAAVQHRYRTSLRELRRQWRGYAAGRAWLSRRYEGFRPEPALTRAVHRRGTAAASTPGRREPRAYMALDALLGLEELAGFLLSNRPPGASVRGADVVLVADRFPAPDDPLAELALTLAGARVEAAARPRRVDLAVGRAVAIEYREDDGWLDRAGALAALLPRRPLRCALEAVRRREPGLSALAPAVRRLERDRAAPVQPLGSGQAAVIAERLRRLAGR